MPPPRAISWLRALLTQVAVFSAILAAAEIGFGISTVPRGLNDAGAILRPTPMVWLPPGVALAACLLAGWRAVPAIIAGSAVSFLGSGGFGEAGLPMALGSGLVPGCVAALLRHSRRFDPTLATAPDLARLLAIAIPISIGCDVAVGTASLQLLDTESWSVPGGRAADWLSQWSIWAAAACVGATLITPTILLLASTTPRRPSAARAVEFFALALALGIASFVGLLSPHRLGLFNGIGSFLPVPFVLLLALRFDRLGAAVATLAVGAAVLSAAVLGLGPFGPGPTAQSLPNLVTLWALTLGLASTALVLGIIVASKRRQAEELHGSAEMLRRIVEAARLGSWAFDARWSTVECSPRLAAMLGYSVEGMRGRRVVDLVSPAARDDAMARLARAVAQGGGEVDLECMRGDGQTVWLAVHVTPGPERSDGRGAIAAVADLSERRRTETEWLRLEANLLHSQKLESLGVLAGGIAHDFNNIVMGIRGNAGLLRVGGARPRATRDTANRIDALCARAADLVSRLLAYAGRGTQSTEGIDLARALREAVGVARLAAPATAVIELEPMSEAITVEGDSAHFRQLLVSVLTNATESFGTSAGRVEVATRRVGSPETPEIEIVFADNGCGMDASTLDRVFEPFFTTKALGRGLGMSAAIGIAERMGGDISIDSTRAEGTTVRLRLPITAARSAGATTAARAPADRRPVAIVVESDMGLRQLLRMALEIRGFAVSEERSIADGLAAVAARAVAVVVADAGASPLEALDAIRTARENNCRTPIVLTTENRDSVVLHPRDPRTVWLPRPFDVRQLLREIDRATSVQEAAMEE